MTLSGFRTLQKEHEALTKVERPVVLQRIADAAAEGDRSENAEYIYGRKRLRELDKRLAYLSTLLGDVEIVDPTTLSGAKVCFGATVVIEEGGGKKNRWQIVGEGESDTALGSISCRSPMARALLGKGVGDVVVVERPAGEIEIEILELWFADRRVA
ncbi:MAG: GreA/GreB family elongation factor [Deltaproteobacteria bacterium]|nr:GreA/GreB family elongation factor [Deltaproteobacteria bacterium]